MGWPAVHGDTQYATREVQRFSDWHSRIDVSEPNRPLLYLSRPVAVRVCPLNQKHHAVPLGTC